MGALKKFEQRLEGFVNGAFAKVFKSEVQPVEIAGALQRECDNNASIWNRDRTVVPNDFIVELSPHDHERLSPYSGQLGNELAGMVREYAQAQRYSFMGPLSVQLERAEDLDTGLYRVRSRIQANEAAQAPAQPQYQPQPPAAPYGGRAQQAWQPQPAQPPMAPPPAAPPLPGIDGPTSFTGNPSQRPGEGGPQAFPGAPTQAAPVQGPVGANTRRWLELNGQRHQLDRPVLVLGRSTEADIRVDDPGVSRRHAEVRVGNPSMVLDLGSTNGIVVDGQHTTRATLRDGSRIVVGSTTIVYRQAEG
ncbi:FhaA domain-containing protein [Streptacidiphilus neutrinimicus]|uniref:FhaA domain-containing protein n=1 Tax=Streptacidiphilus neutrinimicus TaxID=105420 RepID=UPI0005A76B11|nr:DUF3662 and FHA domain-containing protein [Streptacidiphilus neutrinimicus]